jgi:hypothetical protein
VCQKIRGQGTGVRGQNKTGGKRTKDEITEDRSQNKSGGERRKGKGVGGWRLEEKQGSGGGRQQTGVRIRSGGERIKEQG